MAFCWRADDGPTLQCWFDSFVILEDPDPSGSAHESAAVRSNAVVLLLFIDACVSHRFVWGGYVWSLFCCTVLSIVSSFAIISLRKGELVVSL